MSSSLISHPKGENKMELISMILDSAYGILAFFVVCILVMIAIVTFPIWIIPYLIFRR